MDCQYYGFGEMVFQKNEFRKANIIASVKQYFRKMTYGRILEIRICHMNLKIIFVISKNRLTNKKFLDNHSKKHVIIFDRT